MKNPLKSVLVILLMVFASQASGNTLKDAENAFLNELKKVIPKDMVVPVAKLHQTWEAIQAGKSKAIIIDTRTHEEFDAGHILGSNNIDSGHAYSVPKKFSDPDTELWVLCRTQHRASYFVSMLYKYGYKKVHLVEGGIVAWIEEGYPLFNEYIGEFVVSKYSNRLEEDFIFREGH